MTRKIALGALLALSAVLDSTYAQTPDEAALEVMAGFLEAFNARDEQAWANTLHFPHVRLASGQVTVFASAKDFVAAMDLNAFARNTGWHHSTWDVLEVVQSSESKVHITVTFSRFTASGDTLASYPSLYIVEKLDGRWGVRARSSFAP